MNPDPYSPQVRRLFATTAHAGEAEGGVSASAETEAARITLSAQVAAGQVETLRFLAWGCPHFIAAAEAFCDRHEGEALGQLEAFGVAEIMQILAIPVEKTGRILVLEDAARALAKAARALG